MAMSSKRDITDDLFLDDVDGGVWNNTRDSDGSKRRRRSDRSSEEDYPGRFRKMRGRFPEEPFDGRIRRRVEDKPRFEESRRTAEKRSSSEKKTRRKRSSSSSGSSSGSSRSSDSSSPRRKRYSRHHRRNSGSASPKRFSPKSRGRGSTPPYSGGDQQQRGGMQHQQPTQQQSAQQQQAQQQATQQQGGWYQQGFPAPSQQPNFQNMQMTQHVYSTSEGGYGTNYTNQGFSSNYQSFPTYETSGSGYGYHNLGQNFVPPNPSPAQDYRGGGGGGGWDNMIYPDTSMPPPIQSQPLPVPEPASSQQQAPSQAVEQELIQQRRTLSKQREDYLKKSNSLKNELNRLKDQKRELLQENSKDNERILRENAKLQNEIQQKLKAINNVIEMLSGIIGDNNEPPEKEMKLMSEPKPIEKKKHSADNCRMLDNSRNSSSPEVTEVKYKNEKPQVNLIHYDPELHWCSECNVFPRTAVDYLNHLHTEEHKQKIISVKNEDLPWHLNQPKEKIPAFNKHAPNKRIPIRGLQFFMPVSAWYCKLCQIWMGDMHCASNHLKSSLHCDNYSDYISQNPHWEVDWLSDRTRSYERNSESKSRDQKSDSHDLERVESRTVNLSSLSDQLLAMLAATNKAGMKTESESSETSSSDSSGKRSKKKKKKKSKKKSKKDDSPKKLSDPYTRGAGESEEKFILGRREGADSDDKIIREWMAPPPESMDREMSSLKGRLKQKQESEQQRGRRESSGSRRGRDRERERDRDRGRREDRRRGESPQDSDRSRRGDREVGGEREPKGPPQGRIWAPGKEDEEESETVFEKRTSESAAKKREGVKKPPLMSLPKTKLPFIGRMPILKKKPTEGNNFKPEENKKPVPVEEEKKEVVEVPPPPQWIQPEVPEPPVLSTETLPKSTLIISKRPRLAEPDPPRGGSRGEDIVGEQDMDIEDDTPKDELHKDFKDALELLFPSMPSEKEKSEEKEEVPEVQPQQQQQQQPQPQQPPEIIHPGYMMSGYEAWAQPPPPGMAYPTYPNYMVDPSYMGYMAPPQQEPQPPPPPGMESEKPPTPPPPTTKRKNPLSQRMRRHLQKKAAAAASAQDSDLGSADEVGSDDEQPLSSAQDDAMSDLAMLGIDEEDITAQSFH